MTALPQTRRSESIYTRNLLLQRYFLFRSQEFRPSSLSSPWSLPWGDEHALLLCIMRPSPGPSFSTLLLSITLHSRFELWAEMADETLQRPCKRFSQSCCIVRTGNYYTWESKAGWNGNSNRGGVLPQMVCPSTCFVNSCNMSISRSLP